MFNKTYFYNNCKFSGNPKHKPSHSIILFLSCICPYVFDLSMYDVATEILQLLHDLGIFYLAVWSIHHIVTKWADRKFEKYKTEPDHNKTREFQVTLDTKAELYKAELRVCLKIKVGLRR